ncbi:MAG: L,D-transpeptidase [Rhodobacteraceae bacterium]|nr:L,D-transpeptidase [Paracoccaceae bacterium]
MPAPHARALGRRAFLGATAAGLAALAAPALAQDGTTEFEGRAGETVRRNMSGFRALRWEAHFASLAKGAILVDIDSRAVHFWGESGTVYKLYPSSVPLSEDLTRRGRTEVVLKDPNPSWRPTPAMKLRNPEWPDFVPPGPDNPLGTRALRLSWQYYRIHGTHDTRKIGRRSSNGCIGLYNEHIEELFGLAEVGTQVLLI